MSRARERLAIKRQYGGCEGCRLRGSCKAPIPPSFPVGRDALFTIVGDAPSLDDDRYGRIFTGPPGRLFKGLLGEVGVGEDDVSWVGVVGCRGEKVGVDELGACREKLLATIDSSGSPYVFLVGGTAVSVWRSDVKLSMVHGYPFKWLGKYVVVPTFHPAGVKHDPIVRIHIRDDLAVMRRLAEGKIPASSDPFPACVICAEVPQNFDPDQVPYCMRHWGKKGGVWNGERNRWTKVRVKGRVADQEVLFR